MKLGRNFIVMIFAAVLWAPLGCVDESTAPPAGAAEPVVAQPAVVTETVEAIRDKSSISFVGRKVTGQHDGGFRNFTATLGFENGEPVSVVVDLDMTSIWSDNDRLTNHLKSGDFFLVEQYPAGRFESTSIETAGAGQYQITGNLEMRGQQNSITFPATIDTTEDEIHAVAEFTIDRQKWGVSFPGVSDDLIRNDVEVRLDMTFPKPDSMVSPMGEGESSMSAPDTGTDASVQ